MTDEHKTPTSQWPVEVNGHSVAKVRPGPLRPMGSGQIEYDEEVAFECQRCDHKMHPPKGRIEDSEWVKNAFDCVECEP